MLDSCEACEVAVPPPWTNYLSDAAAESMSAYHADTMFALLQHARISRPRAAEFWERVDEVIRKFTQLPREGDTVYGLVAGLYPTDHPVLPAQEPDSTA
ncbi:MAG: hypothetical protein H0X18_04915 [Geodermatophilaceae bacterium]|nr:hypothetical protein [Geodermatophilaceae bacterium]